MKIKELDQLRYLKTEISTLENEIMKLESRATSSTYRFSHLPKSSSTTDKTAMAAEISDLKDTLVKAKIRAVNEYTKFYNFIMSIPDSYIRQMLIEHCINNKTWVQISMSVGGGNTASGCKVAVARYLQKLENNQ